jgi:hypothetical protein
MQSESIDFEGEITSCMLIKSSVSSIYSFSCKNVQMAKTTIMLEIETMLT